MATNDNLNTRESKTYVRESGGNSGLYFILGAVVVVLGVILFFVLGGDDTVAPTADAPSSVSITNEAPEGGDAAAVTTEESTEAAPAEETTGAAEGEETPATE